MKQSESQIWERFQKYYIEFQAIGLGLDLSRTELNEAYLQKLAPQTEAAFESMERLEAGEIANPDEKRMVGQRTSPIPLRILGEIV